MRCPECNNEAPDGSKFCNECGARFVVAAAPTGPERAPRDYTPQHLAERILTTRAALEGERKQLTVLFADVRRSSELAEQLDPEDWHRILDRFFQILSEGVHLCLVIMGTALRPRMTERVEFELAVLIC